MKKLLLLVMSVFLISGVSFAQEEDNFGNSFYLGGSIGYTNTSVNQQITDTFSTKLNDSVPLFTGQAGFQSNKYRVEFAYQGRSTMKDSFTYGGYKYNEEMRTALYLVNGFYQFPQMGITSPYLGIGIGEANADAKIKVLNYSETESDNSFALAFYVGTSLPLDYTNTTFLDFGADFFTFKVFHKNINNISPHLGLRFLFN